MTAINSNVLEWYKDCYPTDIWVAENMNPSITFQDVKNCLLSGGNVYTILGVDDSIARERVFDKLATLMGCEYDMVYRLWIDTDTSDNSDSSNQLQFK